MKNTKKILVAISILISLLLANVVFATTTNRASEIPEINSAVSVSDYENAPANSVIHTKGGKTIVGFSRNILEMLQLIGISVGLIMIVVIGIRYIVNADKDQPEFKKVVINFIFGAVCIFGATTILTFIQNLVLYFRNGI